MDSKQKVTVKRLKLGKMYQSPRQRLWNEIRKSSQRFSTKDISFAAEINYASAHSYITALKKAGIISEIERIPRRGKSRAIEMIYFKLDKDSGYTAPTVRRNGEVVDERSFAQAMWNNRRRF